MSTADFGETPLRNAIRHELQAIRGEWIWLVVLGVCPDRARDDPPRLAGDRHPGDRDDAWRPDPPRRWLEIVGPFWCREWSGFFLASLSASWEILLGLMLLAQPDPGRDHTHDPAGELPLRGRHPQGRRRHRSSVRRMGLAAAQRGDRPRAGRDDLA